MSKAAPVLYGVFGGLALIAGAVGVVAPGVILPPGVAPIAHHLTREQAAGFVLIGFLLLWCVRHAEPRRPVHLAVLIFTGLFAAIHWREFAVGASGLWSPIVNTIPSVLFALTMPPRAIGPAGR